MGCGAVGGEGMGQRGNSERSVEGTQESGHSLGSGPAGPGRDSQSITASDAMHRGVDMGQRSWRERLFENKQAVNAGLCGEGWGGVGGERSRSHRLWPLFVGQLLPVEALGEDLVF